MGLGLTAARGAHAAFAPAAGARKCLDARFEVKEFDEEGWFAGRASVYGVLDAHGDVVMPGAFTETIAANGGVIKILSQHDPANVVGKARLIDKSDGLWVEGKLVLALPDAYEAYLRLRNGLIDSMSIGYSVPDGGAKFVGGVRQLSKIDLWEVSLVTFPANDQARITEVKNDAHPLAALAADIARTTAAMKSKSDMRRLYDVVRDMRRTLGR